MTIGLKCAKICKFMSDEKVINSAGSLIIRNGKILLLLRDNKEGVLNPNTWCLIGGLMEDGENSEEVAKREAKEEIGIDLREIHHILTKKHPSGGTVSNYLAVISDEDIKQLKLGNEGQKINFFSFEGLAGIPLSGSIKRLYENNRSELKKMMETGLLVLLKI